MALYAVADRRRMNRSFERSRIFFAVAGQAQRTRCAGGQLYVGCILIVADFVASRATHRHGGVDRFPCGLLLVATNTGGGVGFGIELDRMLGCDPVSGK